MNLSFVPTEQMSKKPSNPALQEVTAVTFVSDPVRKSSKWDICLHWTDCSSLRSHCHPATGQM